MCFMAFWKFGNLAIWLWKCFENMLREVRTNPDSGMWHCSPETWCFHYKARFSSKSLIVRNDCPEIH